jgi:cell division protein FtsL
MFNAISTVITSFFSIFSSLFSAANRYAKLADDISKNHAQDIKMEHQLNSLKRKNQIDKARNKVGLTSDNANAFKTKLAAKAKAD